jgi:DNA helicase-2/ATP-dependent DNA helicase PcrA
MILNKEQQEAINAINGVWVVIAGPGSGKTTVMIQRYLNMLCKGINMNDILNLTFTNAAASEMVRRVGITDADKVFRTFHSFAIEILKKEREHLPFQLCETVIPVATEDYKLLFDLVRQFPAINNFRTLKEKIAKWKQENIEPEQAIEEARHQGVEYFYALAYEEYEKKCREQGWLDFDDCIRETVKLLETNDEVRLRWKRKYISIDECQDTNVIQFRLLQLLFDNNIFAVGDENQNVYNWRGSQTGNLTNFAQKFPGAKTLYLGQNYRSTKKLVEFFKEILPVDNGIGSHMITENDHGVEPVVTEYEDDVQEAHAVLAKVTDPVNTAVIARTNRQLFIFQKLCVNLGIKYKILGKKDFFETNEVRKLLRLAKESNDVRPADQVLSSLIYEHNLINIYGRSDNPMDSDPIENLNSIVKMAAGKGTVPEFLDRLRKLTYGRKSAKGLTLSTVHQMKGREADYVFVAGVSQGRLPHKDGEINEERRLWFVACSRAAKSLNISFYGNRSEFLNDYVNRIEVYGPIETES